MATGMSIVLVMLAVCCAIVSSQNMTAHHHYDTSSGNGEQQLVLVTETQTLMQEIIHQRTPTVEQLQEDVQEFISEFSCHFYPCAAYSCTFLANDYKL